MGACQTYKRLLHRGKFDSQPICKFTCRWWHPFLAKQELIKYRIFRSLNFPSWGVAMIASPFDVYHLRGVFNILLSVHTRIPPGVIGT